MFNIQPGMGLGFAGSKEIALGLGAWPVVIPPVVVTKVKRGGIRPTPLEEIKVLELDPRILRDDQEILEFITIVTKQELMN